MPKNRRKVADLLSFVFNLLSFSVYISGFSQAMWQGHIMQHENTASDRTELFMKDTIRVLAAGGDIRQIWCAAAIDGMPGYAAEICGFEREMIPDGLERLAGRSGEPYDCLLLPVRKAKWDEKVNNPSCNGIPEVTELPDMLTSDAVILTGGDKRQTESSFP